MVHSLQVTDDSYQIMARAVLLPITNFNPGTPRLDGREARLKAMISNSDAHDREVRNRMFSATFAPDAIEANKTRPEITEQTTPEVLAASDSLRRCKEYNTRAAQQRQFLNETLRKYDGSAASSPATTAGARRESTGMAPVAPMGAPAAVMEGVRRTGVAPTAPMMTKPTPAPLPTSSAAQMFPFPYSNPNIDASRDPRRR
ncbi:hypothetical protein D6C84_04564 [Aureobasidium pullulans]|uniref:Uncharacterized protein n=1 Tax=Aureobasidium pullulans TaxID=5580 RepID=A0A4S9XUT2_AURPU|nr:hypothetical protein D6C84_04564 [Aureobasidium pullulans]